MKTVLDPSGAIFRLSLSERLEVELSPPANAKPLTLFAALADGSLGGSAVVPFGREAQGSTVLLPFRANRLLWVRGGLLGEQRWDGTCWGAPTSRPVANTLRLEIEMPVKAAFYAKAMEENDGWGQMIAAASPGARWANEGYGDQAIPTAWEMEGDAFRPFQRSDKLRIYQLFPRLFGNTNPTQKPHGTLAENGCGKFSDLSADALVSLRALGFTHLWLLGVLRQATATDYSAIGLPPDDPDILKGTAGSPYAVRDVFDLSPDYAANPAERHAEFRGLLERIHATGLKAIIDLVPNHVARSHRSVTEPDFNFGEADNVSRFFDPQNNFFYLSPGPGGPPLVLPAHGFPGCDGYFEAERSVGRVTGNNAVTWRPGINDWYETVKLNYGFDFTTGVSDYPNANHPAKPIPDTWLKMDRVIAHWQALGVNGFRCDMAHLIPPEFWGWAIDRARQRAAETVFIAEAYNNDPARVPSRNPVLAALYDGAGHTTVNLLDAGFDAVYDDPAYKIVKQIYDGSAWANDLDTVLCDPFLAPNALRYCENHDEVRLAAPHEWGGIGMNVGRPVSAILYGLTTGPVLCYNGQEVGEPGGDRSRTPLFDYGQMPELAKWVNNGAYDGGQLNRDQLALRAFYSRLLNLLEDDAFRKGRFHGLNAANAQSPHFGRLHGENCSGHWVYAFLRYAPESGRRFLVVANLHPGEAFREVAITIPRSAASWLDLAADAPVLCHERLSSSPPLRLLASLPEITLPVIPPLTPYYFELAPR